MCESCLLGHIILDLTLGSLLKLPLSPDLVTQTSTQEHKEFQNFRTHRMKNSFEGKWRRRKQTKSRQKEIHGLEERHWHVKALDVSHNHYHNIYPLRRISSILYVHVFMQTFKHKWMNNAIKVSWRGLEGSQWSAALKTTGSWKKQKFGIDMNTRTRHGTEKRSTCWPKFRWTV